jgi:peptide-methionine (R)-S-oxide reductase
MATDRVELSDEQWRQRLTPEQYAITRGKGTEPPFSGLYWDAKDNGVYRCVACHAALFDSSTKYDSGTGWPSFTAPIEPGAVAYEQDRGHGMVRTEALCARCGAHLGHVFDDGPEPSGQRYCMNSIALDLETQA